MVRDRRLELQDKLVEILGSKNVYFQPPESVKLKYPCIIYEWTNEKSAFADNRPYNRQRSYTVTVIDRNPDSEIPSKIADLPKCRFSRAYPADNLNHYIYNLFW